MVKNILILIISLGVTLSANVGKIVALKGELSIQRDNTEVVGKLGSIILQNDQLQTKDNSKTQLLFNDNTVVTIGKNSLFKVQEYIFDEANKEYKTNFGLLKGTFRTITGKIGKFAPNKFKLNSKTSSIGIRGTQILSKMAIRGDRIACIEGEIIITHLKTGETIIIKAGEFVDLGVDTKILKSQKLTDKDIGNMDEDTRFTPNDERETVLDDLGVVIESENVAWGEWNEEADENENLYTAPNQQGIGDVTNPDVIVNATHTATYKGKIEGKAGGNTIIDNSHNLFQMDVNFGTKNISNGIVRGNYSGTQEFKHDNMSGTVKSDGTGFNLQGNTGVLVGSGKFYGSNGNIVKGDISNLQNNGAGGSTDSFTGTFNATSD